MSEFDMFTDFIGDENEILEPTRKPILRNSILFERINSKEEWIKNKSGLGMKDIINQLFINKYGEKYTKEDFRKEKLAYDLIRNNNTNITQDIFKKQFKYVRNRNFILVNGIWHSTNKLDTNYSDQSDILVHIILSGKNGDNPFNINFNYIYSEILTGDVKKGLLLIKDKNKTLKDVINYYLPNKEDFLRFDRNTLRNTQNGDNAEMLAISFFQSTEKWQLYFSGFNGSTIDIGFSIDLIFNDTFNYRYLTMQVKNKKPEKWKINELFYSKNIDIIAWLEDGKVCHEMNPKFKY